jgi:hypothetical protein
VESRYIQRQTDRAVGGFWRSPRKSAKAGVIGGPTEVKLGTGSWLCLRPENLGKSSVSCSGMDHKVTASDLCGHVHQPGNPDYGGNLLPCVTRTGAVNIDLHNAIGANRRDYPRP